MALNAHSFKYCYYINNSYPRKNSGMTPDLIIITILARFCSK
jgi:hypothetical protein